MPAEIRHLLQNLRVLYIEDEEFTRNELSMYLKRRVGQLFTAQNGAEGLSAFTKHKPDLILTDLKMPEMGGIELIKAVRDMGSDCPVIVITALSDSETILKTVDLGIVKYVIKPLNTTELMDQMEALAGEILKKKQGATILNGQRVLEKEEKQEAEKKIKSAVANFLKHHTGKGPRDLQVFIHGSQVEVNATEVLTPFELALLPSRKNYGLVDYNRKVFYEENQVELEEKIGEVLGSKLKLVEIHADSKSNKDFFILKID